MNGRGDLLAPAGGHEGLAHLYRAGDRTPTPVGEAFVPPSGPSIGAVSASPLTLRDQVLRGEIPDAFRNSVKPILGEDGQVWLVTEADAILHRYAADGSLIWSKALIAPEIQQSQQQFIQAWDEYAPGRGVPEPQPVRAAAAIGNELWLSLREAREGGSVVAIHDADTGELRRRLVLNVASPMGPFAVDRLRGYLYFVLVEEASLLRARLPQ